MAFITLAGTLRDPTSELAVGDQIRFTHKSTTGETVEGAVSVLTIDPSGTYSKDLQYGLVLVEYKDVRTSQFKNLGVATVNGSNPATSIPELLNALVPVSSAELIEFQAILADAVTARNEAEAFANSIDLINDLSQAYIFDTVAEYKASSIVFPVGKTVHLNDRNADFKVIAGTGTATERKIIASSSVAQSIDLIVNDVTDVQAWGAISDNTYTTDSSLAIQDAADYIKTFLPIYSKKLIGGGNYFLSSDVNLRQLRCDFSDGGIGVDTGVELVIGGLSNEGFSPTQQFGQVFRKGEPINTPNPLSPIMVVKGAKGQTIDIDFCPHVQLYADTDSSKGGKDSSIAYSTFNLTYTQRLHLTNNPSSDGSATQWINENTFNMKRTLDLIVDGTYDHNNNIFNQGNFEGACTVDFETGNSNRINFGRFENSSGGTIHFGATTWGNVIVKAWYSNWRNVYEDFSSVPPVTDEGRGNMVTRTSDTDLRNAELLAITRGTAQSFEVSNKPVTTVKNFFVSSGDADSYHINGAFRNFYISDLIPVDKMDGLSVSVNGEAKYRFTWSCFGADGEPVVPVDLVNAGTDANTKSISGNRITQSSNVASSLIVIFDDSIKFIKLDCITGSGVTAFDFDTFTIKGKTSYLKARKWADNSLCAYQSAAVASSPTRGFASLGQVVEDTAGAGAYKCTFSFQTYAISGSSTTLVINASAGSGYAIGDIIGIKETTGTHWTTITNVSSNTLTLNDALLTALIGNETLHINRWITKP